MSHRVLIIEDSQTFSHALKEVIQSKLSVEVDIAASYQEAKQLVENPAIHYFATTIDYNLPDAPNGEAIDLMVSLNIPSIVFTGNTDRDVRRALWERGISDYASKSGVYNFEYVANMVKRIFDNQYIEVLIVDDSLLDRKRIEHLLQKQGLVTHTANSATNALKILESAPNICLAIVDYYMEVTDGAALSGKLRESLSREEFAIIGISAATDPSVSADIMKSGADDFLFKPYLPEELFCRVNQAIERIEAYRSLNDLNQTKNRFIGMAAHDIRGPLGAIHTASKMLRKDIADSHRKQKLFEMIESNSDSLLHLLDTLLDVSAIESGDNQANFTRINLTELVKERITLFETNAHEKQQRFVCNLEEGVTADIDELKIKQVFDNLITNSVKYSLPNKSIKIKLVSEQAHAVFSIEDGGPGIPTHEQEKLFVPFELLSHDTTGGEKRSGIGLVIAKSIVDMHNGSIIYRNDEEVHSTVLPYTAIGTNRLAILAL